MRATCVPRLTLFLIVVVLVVVVVSPATPSSPPSCEAPLVPPVLFVPTIAAMVTCASRAIVGGGPIRLNGLDLRGSTAEHLNVPRDIEDGEQGTSE